MTEIGIVPSPDSPYVELGGTGGVRRFAKHILSVGETFVHPGTGKPLTVDESWWTDLKKNWDDKVVPICQFPAADEKNRHTENPLMNLGRVVDLRREGQKIMADIEVPDAAVADKIGSTILGASAMLHMDYRDSRSGQRRGKALIHVAATNHPHLVSLDPYRELVAATAQAWDVPGGGTWTPRPEALMLCASDPDLLPPVTLADPDPQPDYQRERDYLRDYGGTAGMDEDYLTGEAHRLGQLAYQESRPGRGSKPEYGMIITDRDRHAKLAAEREVTDEQILGLTRELAGECHVSTDTVHAMVHDVHRRSGLGRDIAARVRVLGEVGLALAAGQLEVSDDAVLALSQAYGGEDEVLRLTSEPDQEGMFGLAAHPSKAGKMVSTKTRAHSTDEDPSFDVEAEIERLLAKTRGMFGAQDRGAAGSGNTAHPAKTASQRDREETHALAGGRPGGRSIGALHPSTLPGTSGSVRG